MKNGVLLVFIEVKYWDMFTDKKQKDAAPHVALECASRSIRTTRGLHRYTTDWTCTTNKRSSVFPRFPKGKKSAVLHQRRSCNSSQGKIADLAAGYPSEAPQVIGQANAKRFYVVLVGYLEGVDIAAPKVSLRHDIRSTPSEYGSVLHPRKYIGHEPCMTTVAIGEEMDRDQT